MNRENSQEDSNLKQGKTEQKELAENLEFMRSAIERACRQVKPKTSNSVMWGLICMTIYVGIHFLINNQLFNWIRPLQMSLISFGVLCTIIQGHFLFKKLKKEGFVPQFLFPLSYGLIIISLPILFFDVIGLFKGMYCGSAFIYALTINTVIVIIGVLHSKLWFIGTAFVIIGILMAFIFKEYSYMILGITVGTGIILSASIVDLNYRKQEKENAQA